ncbi:putative MFS transporter [Ilyonectria robusta]
MGDSKTPTGECEPSPVPNSEPQAGLAYSIFTTTQKKWIVVIAASASWFSTASSFIYFPAIPFMSQDLGVSTEKINLTVTSYLIASGIFPAITGSAADRYGRRPVFIVSLGAYVAVNIGLAVQRSFPVLFVLRMLQSIAISGTVSFAYGVVGDLITPAERGGYVGVLSVFLNTPPSIAPLITGLLLLKWTWPSIFWFLSIISPCIFFTVILLFPETCRNIVGNGSYTASRMGTPSVSFLRPLKDKQVQNANGTTSKQSGLPNPFSVLKLLNRPGNPIAVLCFGVYYTIYSCLQASLSTIFVEIYDISGLVSGLIYIPFGLACAFAAFLAGRVLDADYRKIAKIQGFEIDRHQGDDLSTFPIEHARLRTSKYFIAACAPLIAGYGWALWAKTYQNILARFWSTKAEIPSQLTPC